MHRSIMQGFFLLACFCAGSAYGECTARDKQTMRDTGMSEYHIDQLCGETKDRPVVKEDDRVQNRPDTHGRLQEASNICQTEVLWCILSQDGPPGTPCVCQSSYGPIKGVIVRR